MQGWNDFLKSVELPPSNIAMDRWYQDGGKNIGWHSGSSGGLVSNFVEHGATAREISKYR